MVPGEDWPSVWSPQPPRGTPTQHVDLQKLKTKVVRVVT
jgi:hypothetical protein